MGVAAGALFALSLAAPTGLQAGESITIAALGDSLVQGFGLHQEEGFVPRLEAWLHDAGHDVEVSNAGVSGDTTAGGLARMGWTLADDPDAMIVALGGNDLLRGIDPAESRANLEEILRTAASAGVPVLLVGMPAPGNYGPEYEADFAAMYPELAEEYDVTYHENFLEPITARIEAGEPIDDLMQDDRIHPNADGVALVVEAIGPSVAALLEDLDPDDPSG